MNPLVVQGIIAGGMKLFELGTKWLEHAQNNPDMTQDELDEKWAEMQAELIAVKSAHDALRDKEM